MASRFLIMDVVWCSRLVLSLSSSDLRSWTRTSYFFFCSLRCCLMPLRVFSDSSSRLATSTDSTAGLMRWSATSPSSSERFSRLRRSHSLAYSRCCCCCWRPPWTDALPSSRSCLCKARTCCFNRVASFCWPSVGPCCATPCLCLSRSFCNVSFSSSCASSCCCRSATSLRNAFMSSTRFVWSSCDRISAFCFRSLAICLSILLRSDRSSDAAFLRREWALRASASSWRAALICALSASFWEPRWSWRSDTTP
mmetsp:Transcript_7213/g.22291  ORF Transcript_7213/g.22291 Transcript_7213/m.22291 type:complete len:253 (+) Transcript_7213:1071-1829(+)